MLHDVENVFSVGSVLAVIHGEGTITDHSVERRPEAVDIKAVRGNDLPREIASDAEAAHVSLKCHFLIVAELMTDTASDEGVDPFEITGAGNCHCSIYVNLRASLHRDVLAGPEFLIDRTLYEFRTATIEFETSLAKDSFYNLTRIERRRRGSIDS